MGENLIKLLILVTMRWGESYKTINPSNYEMGENLIKLLILVTIRWGESYKTINPSNYEMRRIL
jgi:hypothetical protein